jgi:hypothetical protein
MLPVSKVASSTLAVKNPAFLLFYTSLALARLRSPLLPGFWLLLSDVVPDKYTHTAAPAAYTFQKKKKKKKKSFF